MSQTTLDDDELFSEAASEMHEDVEAAVADAHAALPDSDAIWRVDADNTLGVLNGLKSALDTGDAEAHLRDAKKWYTMGERANAFDDNSDLGEAIARIESLIERIDTAHGLASDLASTLPELRGDLDDAYGED